MQVRYDVISPFSGKIDRVYYGSGQRVEEGGVLFILEAQGISHEILSPVTGVMDHVDVDTGESVMSGMILTRIIEK